MANSITLALQDPGPHTAATLAARLPGFPPEAIQQALDTLAAQGVLQRSDGPDGTPSYVYVDPSRYTQASLDVVRNPGDAHNRRRR